MSSTKVNNRYIPFALIIINCSNKEEVIPYFPIFLIVIIDRDITIPVPLVFVFKNFYQQLGDAKKPYFLQYSVVVSEDAPVTISNTTIKKNMPIKNRLKPLKANFNAF